MEAPGGDDYRVSQPELTERELMARQMGDDCIRKLDAFCADGDAITCASALMHDEMGPTHAIVRFF